MTNMKSIFFVLYKMILIITLVYFPDISHALDKIDSDKNIFSLKKEYVFYPTQTDEILFNPGQGLLCPTWKMNESILNDIKQYTDIAYTRFTWSQLEPEEGEYRFDIITSWIENWRKKGFNRFGFGVMSSTAGSQATPLWVFDAGIPGVRHRNGSQMDPVYWNEPYLEKVGILVRAMSEALENEEQIEFIDMRNIGVWGEMHFGYNKGGMWTEKELIDNGYSGKVLFNAYKKMIGYYKNYFPETRLFLVINNNYELIIKYAATEGINLRHDGLNYSENASMGIVSDFFQKYGYSWPFIEKDLPQQNPEFEVAFNQWSPVSGIELSPGDSDCTKIVGRQSGEWNFAHARIFDDIIEKGKKYRLEGWMKVDSLSNEFLLPFLKVQTHDQNDTFVENYNTNKYDTSHIGEWQQLSVEFKVGENEEYGYVAVEKGTTRTVNVEMSIKDVSLYDVEENMMAMEETAKMNPIHKGVQCNYEFSTSFYDFDKLRKTISDGMSDPLSYLTLNCFKDNVALNTEEVRLVKQVSKKLGYRFMLDNIITKVEKSEADPSNIQIKLTQSWLNSGTAPCYDNFVLKYVVVDQENNIVGRSEQMIDPLSWSWKLNKKHTIVSKIDIFNFQKEEEYSLKVGLFDKENEDVIKLPLSHWDETSFYWLFNFHVQGKHQMSSPKEFILR